MFARIGVLALALSAAACGPRNVPVTRIDVDVSAAVTSTFCAPDGDFTVTESPLLGFSGQRTLDVTDTSGPFYSCCAAAGPGGLIAPLFLIWCRRRRR